MDLTLTQKIIAELNNQDCSIGQLKDATGATYPEITTALKQLVDEGKAKHCFDSDSALTYQLIKQPFWRI
ncbi:hypothetical protein [Nostoc sp.]|uniref:hypothetical protein n=1 Tax=Nostoc sp. TaxID=1180 RepID=UPI002FF3AEE8